ncbi:MAG TPA: hypothetical protein VLH80_07235 [Nitrospiraceae bacterium]|nr:hypothetical protein [Nitrospiraceae bacterium]
MKVDIHKLDEQIKFLRDQASRLDDLRAKPGNQWATRNADMMRGIAATLLDLRREQQMTGMSGKKIE